MLVGKNRKYKGPRTHHAIIKRILADSKWKKPSLTHYEIEKVVRLFFNSGFGIGKYFRTGNNFFVKGVGLFKPNKKRRYESIVKKVKKRLTMRAKNIERWNKYYARQAEKAKAEQTYE